MSAARPVPEALGISAPFWEAASRNELVLQFCRRCLRHQFYPRFNCTECGGGELDWVRASGCGTIYAFTVAHHAPHPAFEDRLPLVIALVELEEGPRMLTNVIDCDATDVAIGMPVEVTFEHVADGVSLPLFRRPR